MSMRVLVALLASEFFLSASPGFAGAQGNNAIRDVRLAMVAGDAQLRLPGQTTVEKAAANQQLPQGSELQVATGIAEIDFENMGTGFVGGDSVVDMTQLSAGATGRISRLTLERGVARFAVNTHGTDTFTVATTDLTIAPQQLADFRLEIGRDATTVRVLGGQVTISDKGPSATVRKGQTFTLAAGALEGKITETPPLEMFSGYTPIWLLPPPAALPRATITPPFRAIIPPAAPAPQIPQGQQLPGPVSPSDAAHAGAPTPNHPPYPEQPPAYPEIPPKYP